MLVVLMSGVPGSGKSHYTKRLAGNVVVCSADHYFEKRQEDGSVLYQFDWRGLGAAHAACLRKFTETLQAGGADYLVVDNTNTTALELAPYVALAQAYNTKACLVDVLCDPHLAAERNTHGVPLASILRMHDALATRTLPPFWVLERDTVDNTGLNI